MQIKRLRIHDFRCLGSVDFQPAAGINVLTGPNGIGKTSVLEAITFLSSGRSFRTSGIRHLIKHQQAQLAIHAEVHEGGNLYHVGLSKDLSGNLTVRLQDESLKGIAPVSRLVPVVAIHSQSYFLLDSNPESKRRFIDWLVFHVKQEHLTDWKKYRKILLHTNALLKKGSLSSHEADFWYRELATAGEKLHGNRTQIFRGFNELLMPLFEKEWFDDLGIGINYKKGWPDESSLLEALREHDERNRKYGAVQVGPHRMDLWVKSHGVPADKALSRGQKKMVAIHLYLEQLKFIHSEAGRWPILCLDDLDSELDEDRLLYVMREIAARGCQTFISSLHPEVIEKCLPEESEVTVFHVKQWLEGIT